MVELSSLQRCAIRLIAGGFLSLAASASAYSQQITCPVTASTTNTSSTATNALNPCEITSGGALINSSGATLENLSGASLLNDFGATLSNAGSILNDFGATLTNNGSLVNDGSITSSGTINNTGTLNGTGIIFTSGTVNNSGNLNNAFYTFGGSIINTGGGMQNLATGTLIQGGTLNNEEGDLGTAIKSSVTLDGSTIYGAVTIQGTFTTGLFSQTQVVGTINNQGNVVLPSGELRLAGDTTLQGGGTVTLQDQGNPGAFIDGGHILTNVDNTIQGAGVIGNAKFGFPTLVNQAAGTINANVSGQPLMLETLFVNNSGLMEATAGGVLQLDGTVIFNRPTGTITADSGGTVSLKDGTTIVGGTLNNVGGTIESLKSSATLDGSTGFGPVTIQGTFTTMFGTANVLGTINNQGNMLLASGNLSLAGDTTLQGGGTVTLETVGSNPASFINGTGILTNVDNTIQGAGVIDGSGGLQIFNQAGGTIHANVFGGVLEINAAPLTNAGSVLVETGSELVVIAPFTQTAGQIRVDGGMVASQGLVATGGTVLGTGVITGDVNMLGGTLHPGGATTAGTLTINGNLLLSNATFEEFINGSGNGLLLVNGVDTIGGNTNLHIIFADGFTPFSGETFTIMDFSSGSGFFSNAPTTGFTMDGFDWLIDYNSSDIVLIAESMEEGSGSGSGNSGNGTSAPEPATGALLFSALSILAAVSLSRKRTPGLAS